MRLILSCMNEKQLVIDKDHLILTVNTETKQVDWIPLKVSEPNDIVGSKSLCMSGDYLMVSLKTKKKVDKILVIDVVTKRNHLTNCTKSKDIHGMVSVFRGRVYCISTGTDSMNNIVLSPSSYNVIRDVNHYTLDGGGDGKFHITSLMNWNRRWYVSYSGLDCGAIIELSKNNRIVYSDLDEPNSLFFNRNDELCFCESGRGLFHCGRNIFWTGRGYPRGVIEDQYENGYWIAVSGDKTMSRLKFFDYNGNYSDSIDLPYGYNIYDIVEAEGYLSKLL